jgi:hypothetical protein
MENLIKNLVEHLIAERDNEFVNIEKYKQEGDKDLILISSGKLMELDNVIQNLNEMLKFNLLLKKEL